MFWDQELRKIYIYLAKEEELQKLYPTKDTILLSKDGTVGIAYKIKNETEIITVSTNYFVSPDQLFHIDMAALG